MKPIMEMAEQYRMGKNKEIFFVKQHEKRSRKIIFFCFEHFFLDQNYVRHNTPSQHTKKRL